MKDFRLSLTFMMAAAFVAQAVAQEQPYVELLGSTTVFQSSVATGAGPTARGAVIVLSADGAMKLVGLPALTELAAQAPGSVISGAMALSPDGAAVVSGGANGQVTLRSPEDLHATKSFKAHEARVTGVAFGPSSALLVWGDNRVLSLADTTQGKLVRSLEAFKGEITAVALQPDARIFAVATAPGGIGVYSALLLSPLHQISDPQSKVTCLTYSADARLLAAGTADGIVYWWEVGSWIQKGNINLHYGAVSSLAFDPNGRWIATAGSDSTVRLVSLSSGSEVKKIPIDGGSPTFVRFTAPDQLLGGVSDGRLMLWKVLDAPPDEEAPVLTVTEPRHAADGTAPRMYSRAATVVGMVYDKSAIAQVLVNGTPAALRETGIQDSAGRSGRTFLATVSLTHDGVNAIDVEATDQYGNASKAQTAVFRIPKEQALEVVSPEDNTETESVAIPFQFKCWFPVASYEIQVNLLEVAGSRQPLGGKPGDVIKADVPLVMGYNQVKIEVTSTEGERFSKLWAVTRKVTVPQVAVQQTAKPRRDRAQGPQAWAVVIGLSEYANPGIPALKYADKDAEAFAGFLQTPEGGGYDRDHLRVLINKEATLTNVKDALVNFLQNAIDIDLVMIYFAGHGAPEPARPENLYLLTYDTDPNLLATTAFPMWDVQTAIARYITAKRVVVFSDACHSGGISVSYATRGLGVTEQNPINQYMADLARTKEGVVVFTASAAGEVSQEFPELGHGVFTYYLLEGVHGAADFNNDYTVTINELMQYVEEQVKRKTKGAQNPTRSQTIYDKDLTISLLPH